MEIPTKICSTPYMDYVLPDPSSLPTGFYRNSEGNVACMTEFPLPECIVSENLGKICSEDVNSSKDEGIRNILGTHVKETSNVKHEQRKINEYFIIRRIGTGALSDVNECENVLTKKRYVCMHIYIYV
jgi:hypothetical protein